MDAKPDTPNSLVLSYLGLRKTIGYIGIALPFVLVFGKIILESSGILSSISDYYYSVMRDVFVGSLCAIAIFLMSYRGYERRDDIAGNLACVSAIGVALFPTNPAVGATQQAVIIGMVHLFFAVCFFLLLAFFALVLFRQTDQNKQPTRRKLQRNRIYFLCGCVIVACIALIVLLNFLPYNPWIQQLNPIFWFESLAVLAFGISWFVKGETILKDE